MRIEWSGIRKQRTVKSRTGSSQGAMSTLPPTASTFSWDTEPERSGRKKSSACRVPFSDISPTDMIKIFERGGGGG